MTKTFTLAEAKSAISKIENDCAHLIENRSGIGRKLELLQSTGGQRYLSGDRGAIKEIGEFRAELDLIELSLTTLNGQRADAEVDLKRATAADLRNRAELKRSEMAALEAKTGKLLAQLSILENVQYGVGILSNQRQGAWCTANWGTPEPWHAAIVDCQSDPLNHTPFAVPKSRLLRAEIADLLHQAAEIEAELAEPEPEPAAVRLPE